MKPIKRLLSLPLQCNKYDYLLIIYVALLALGNIGGALQPIRVLTIILLPSAILYILNNKIIFRKYRGIVFFCLTWIIYSTFTLLWAHDLYTSFERLLYLIVHCGEFFVIFFLFEKSNNKVYTLCIGWILMFLITCPIALQELFMGKHLIYSKYDESSGYMTIEGISLQRNFAAVTFYNLNTYNTIICFFLPFITALIVNPRRKNFWNRFVTFAIFGLAFFIVVLNSSRGAFLVLTLCVCVVMLKTFRKKIIVVILTFAAITTLVWFLWTNGFFEIIFDRIFSKGLNDNARLTQIFCLLDAVKNSGFFGVGAGNIDYVMATKYGRTLTAPHNLYMEVFAEVGLIIFIMFCAIQVDIFRRARKHQIALNKTIATIGIVLLPIIGVINSVYLILPSFFLYFASLIVISRQKL